MAEDKPKDSAAEDQAPAADVPAAKAASSPADSSVAEGGPPHSDPAAEPTAPLPPDTGVAAPTSPSPDAGASAAADDRAAVWDPFDAALQAFALERQGGVGSYWGESSSQIEGRFVGWPNTCGWRCTLQLVRAPDENVIVLVAQGPPLPGGRARIMVLGAFPPQFEADTLRAALDVGYGIGETWGPAEEPPPPAPSAAEAAAG